MSNTTAVGYVSVDISLKETPDGLQAEIAITNPNENKGTCVTRSITEAVNAVLSTVKTTTDLFSPYSVIRRSIVDRIHDLARSSSAVGKRDVFIVGGSSDKGHVYIQTPLGYEIVSELGTERFTVYLCPCNKLESYLINETTGRSITEEATS